MTRGVVFYISTSPKTGRIRYVKGRHLPTDPQTYSAGDVVNILKGRIDTVTLARLDVEGSPLRPIGYYDAAVPSRLIDRAERDQRLAETKKSARGAADRCYTYQQLLWIGAFCYVKEGLEATGVSNARKNATQAVERLKQLGGGALPSSSRLLFLGCDVYLLGDRGVAECLTDNSQQLAMTQILTDQIEAEVHGRVAVLAAMRHDVHAPLPLGVVTQGRASQ